MTKKENTKNDSKEKSRKKLIKQKAEELLKWKKNNVNQKRFFSLEPREQVLLEETYLVFVQMCPELTWEEFVDHLRKTDNRSTRTKTVAKTIIKSIV